MEKSKKIEFLHRVQLVIWLSGTAIFCAITLWSLVDGRAGSVGGIGGALGLLCVTNYNIVLNRIAIRDAMRQEDTDTPTEKQLR